MKVAFAIDFLVERTPEVFLLELLLAGFDDADIYLHRNKTTLPGFPSMLHFNYK